MFSINELFIHSVLYFPGSSAQLNMRGVFLHVLGDALGSVIVVISALIIKFVDAEWRYKVDPSLSLVMVTIILCTTVPLCEYYTMMMFEIYLFTL